MSTRRLAVMLVMAGATSLAPIGATAATAKSVGGAGSGGSGSGLTLAVASPSAGSTVVGVFAVSGSAAAPAHAKVTSVAVAVDGGASTTASGTTSWSLSIDSSKYANGSHLLSVVAADSKGDTATASVSVGFSNAANGDTTAPSASIAAPAPGFTVGGTTTLYGAASDNVAVAGIAVSVDGGAFRSAVGTTSWTYSLDTTAYANGAHTVVVQAVDSSGNTATSSESLTFANASGPMAAPPMGGGSIGGYVFQDPNHDGLYESGESPLGGETLYLYSGTGGYLTNTTSNSAGWYQFSGLADGAYTIRLATSAWWSLWQSWVPDTTGSNYPTINVSLTGSARADLGWRPIVRSATSSVPISTYQGSNGLLVKSYDDVVPAQTIWQHLASGSLAGAEGQSGTIVFDYGNSAVATTTGTAQSGQVYQSVQSTTWLAYTDWLNRGDYELFYEYGHVWAGYYTFLEQQDGGFGAYLVARGLWGSSNLYSSMQWQPAELIADDYRQLFGDPSAQAVAPLNTNIPPASQVPGLAAFLSQAFMQPATGGIANSVAPRAPSGTAQVGHSLVAVDLGQWMGAMPRSFTFQWERCDSSGDNCLVLASGTYNGSYPSYTLTAADAGATVRIVVTGANAAGSSSALSAPTASVAT